MSVGIEGMLELDRHIREACGARKRAVLGNVRFDESVTVPATASASSSALGRLATVGSAMSTVEGTDDADR